MISYLLSMKRILIILEDEIHEKLVKVKGDMTWEEYLCRDLK